jgi:hypothetical protein
MAAKKGTKKAARKKGTARKATRKAPARKAKASLGPKPVKTGGGATPLQVAQDFIAMARAGKLQEIEHKWLAPGIESVEGMGASMAWNGKKAVLAKYRAWEADHDVHAMQADGPWVGATGFVVKFAVDMTQKSTGQRHQMEEMAVYTVRNGKIVREEFHFAAPTEG